tara:strand:+ start:557 stop:757 length:201 start_codon:yes stop_codon:yes gene_type:complete
MIVAILDDLFEEYCYKINIYKVDASQEQELVAAFPKHNRQGTYYRRLKGRYLKIDVILISQLFYQY